MKKLLFTGLILILSLTSFAQYTREDGGDTSTVKRPVQPQQRNPFWDHVSIGGGLGLQFGTVTFVALSPLFSYHATKDFVLGVGPMYQYVDNSDPIYGFKYSIYGGRITGAYFLPGRLNNVALMGEYDILNVPDYYSPFPQITRAYVYIPLLGIGIRRPIGDKAYYILSGMWDFSHSILSPYSNPTISAGVDFGI